MTGWMGTAGFPGWSMAMTSSPAGTYFTEDCTCPLPHVSRVPVIMPQAGNEHVWAAEGQAKLSLTRWHLELIPMGQLHLFSAPGRHWSLDSCSAVTLEQGHVNFLVHRYLHRVCCQSYTSRELQDIRGICSWDKTEHYSGTLKGVLLISFIRKCLLYFKGHFAKRNFPDLMEFYPSGHSFCQYPPAFPS